MSTRKVRFKGKEIELLNTVKFCNATCFVVILWCKPLFKIISLCLASCEKGRKLVIYL